MLIAPAGRVNERANHKHLLASTADMERARRSSVILLLALLVKAFTSAGKSIFLIILHIYMCSVTLFIDFNGSVSSVNHE